MNISKADFIVILLFLYFIAGCATYQKNQMEPLDSPVVKETNKIFFNGFISSSNVDLFEQLLLQDTNSVTTLVINSRGGDIENGIRMGELVALHKLKVEIPKMCASSCANYIATAAESILVGENAILGWHGGASQSLYVETSIKVNRSLPFRLKSLLLRFKSFFNLTEDEKKFLKDEKKILDVASGYFEKRQKDEELFFDKVQSEQLITVLGMMPGLKELREAPLFSYDEMTLKSLGLRIEFMGKHIEQNRNKKKVLQIFTLSDSELKLYRKLHQKTVASHKLRDFESQ